MTPDTPPTVAHRRWWRRLALLLLAFLFVVVLLVGWLIATESGLRTTWSVAQQWLPENLVIGSVSGRLIGPLELNELSVGVESAAIRVGRLSLTWQPRALLSGELLVSSLLVERTEIQLLPPLTPPEPKQPWRLPDHLEAPVDLLLGAMQVRDLVVRDVVSDTTDTSTQEPSEPLIHVRSMQLMAKWVEQHLNLGQLVLDSDRGSLTAQGQMETAQPYRLGLSVEHTLQPPNLPPLRGSWTAAGSLQQPKINGVLDAPYNLRLDLAVTDTFATPSFVVEAVAESLVLNTLREDLPAVGVSATVNLSGTLNQYDLVLDAVAEYAEHQTPISLRGAGDQQQMTIAHSDVGIGSGGLSATGTVNWVDGLVAALKLLAKDVNPGLLLEQWPGMLDGQVSLNFAQDAGAAPIINVPILDLHGTLLDEPVTIKGQIHWAEDQLTAKNLNAQWADNQLTVNGKAGVASRTAKLQWQVALNNLAKFSPQFAGRVQGHGQLQGAWQSPAIVADLRGSDLSFQDTKIESLNLSADIDLAGELTSVTKASGIVLGEQKVSSITLVTAGTRAAHDVDLSVAAADFGLQANIGGAWPAKQKQWQFVTNELAITHVGLDPEAPKHQWALTEPAAGTLALQQFAFTLDSVCLRHMHPLSTEDAGEVCAQAALQETQQDVTLRVDRLRLDHLNQLLPPTLRVKGVIDGDMVWQGALASARANLELTDGGVSSALGGEWQEVLQFAQGTIAIKPQTSSDGLRFAVDLPLVSEAGDEQLRSGVDLQLTIDTSVTTLAAAPMSGRAQVQLPDLSWLASVAPGIENLTAALDADLAISGALSSPQLRGTATFSVPTVDVPEYQLQLRETQFNLVGDTQGLQLEGSSRSGEGQLQLVSTVGWRDGLEIEGKLHGERFIVSNTVKARIQVSPNLTASYRNKKLTLRGDMVLPLAEIRLNKIPQGAVSVSRDQQIKNTQPAEPPLDIDAKILLQLGDEVTFSGLGLDAKFAGSMTIRDKSDQVTTATGQIDIVEGTYQAYGQDLAVQNGKVIFVGGPITEPGLDVRATRQATPDVQVGVHVLGSMQQPTLTVYSNPSLPESDQLSYLVLGRPLSSSSEAENSLMQQAAMTIGVEGGHLLTDRIGKKLGVDSIGIESAPGTSNAQAALVVGKYLSPKLYVSYGYGLFEPISTIRLEYELSRLWRLVTESTNEATGGDLQWVLEK